MPISSTATWVSSGMARMAMGIPMSLLWFTGVLAVRKVLSSTAATISFVVLFPTEPVMPTTFIGSLCRSPAAIFPRAIRVSSTRIAG